MILACPDLDGAVALVRSGDFAAAWAAAAAEPDALRRAQAELYVRHHAGDLRGALAAGERGLVEHPGDPWLLERVTEIAIALHRADAAARATEELRRVARSAPEADRSRLEKQVAEATRGTAELAEARERRGAALARARITVAAFLVVLLLAFFAVARREKA